MKEKIYSIPVNDAFNKDCECPICSMRKELELNAVEYTMGSSYMEEDTRALTDEKGFCQKHAKQVYDLENRLGMALVLKTHFDKVLKDVKELSQSPSKSKSLFKKNTEENPIVSYISKLNSGCFVCDRINNVFMRYIDTIFFLFKSEKEFKEKFMTCKGFCTEHYGLFVEEAPNHLKGEQLSEFMDILNGLFISNMERVRDDLEWFINKFDYKYADEPWKNAKDSIQRALTKSNSIYEDVNKS